MQFEQARPLIKMEGVYYDPNHGGCVRYIERVDDTHYVIVGAYGDGELGRTGTPWRAYVTSYGQNGHFLIVDFKGKHTKHDRLYHALWCPKVRQIAWQDGNVWKHLHSPSSA